MLIFAQYCNSSPRGGVRFSRTRRKAQIVTAERKTRPDGLLRAGGILDTIVEAKIARLAESKRAKPLDRILDLISQRDVEGDSMAESISAPDRINIIAEIKRQSPSKGIIREDFDAPSIAKSYARSGAAALSVLTEQDYFGGSLDYLSEVREQVATPLLRKDFIFDEYQVYESKAAGAAALLLIVAMLDDDLLARLIELSKKIKLDALVEVHTAREMERAVGAGARIIGINNRDLTTFAVDLETSLKLAPMVPTDTILVSESGITRGEDIRLLRSAGFHAFLVGEHLMRAEEPGDALMELIAEAE